MSYHKPALLEEAVDGLQIEPDGIYVDITFGGGGHSKEILKRLGNRGRLYGFDQDKDALENALDDDRFKLIPANFKHIKRFLRFENIKKVDGILGDFGVSSHQFDVPQRGFSTRFDGKLDMRMDQKKELSAYEVVNQYSREELSRIFWEYGDLRKSRNIARTIVEHRKNKEIVTSGELKDLLKPILFKRKQNQLLAQIYQAIRIEVNGELDALKDFLKQTEDLLSPGGRLSLISYHSLEDRLVKRYIRSGLFKGEPEKDFYGNVSVPFKKVGKLIRPKEEDIAENPRVRSARLRIGERL